MIRKWLRSSLKNQLTFLMLIVVVIPICLLGLFSYYTTIQVSKERAAVSGRSSVDQLRNSINFIIHDIENMSVFLIGNQSVQTYLSEKGELIAKQQDIYGFLSNLAYSKRYIGNIMILPLNGNSPIASAEIKNMDIDVQAIPNGKWWSVKEVNETVDGPKEMITLSRPIRSTNDYRLLGYLSISLNQAVLEEYLQEIDMEWNGSIFILSGSTILAKNKHDAAEGLDLNQFRKEINSHLGEGSFVHRSDKDRATVFTERIPLVNWDLAEIIPYQEFSSQNQYFLWLTVYSVILAALCVIGLVVFFISKVFKPLTMLKESIQNSLPGVEIKTVDSYADNEIGELIRNYNSLNNRVADLMHEMKQNESRKRKLDMQALQSQINPHFLYNTLASVQWIALGTEAFDIAKMVSALSSFLRFSLNKGNEYCTIEQETAHLKHYLEIQEIRYPGAFELELDIVSDIKAYAMLKLVLQPLVENSIIHGFFPLNSHHGIVRVSAEKRGERIHFTVQDNGTGMPADAVENIYQQFQKDKGYDGVIGKNYGIRNVNLRLVLHYGAQSQLFIASRQHKGTCIYFSIPAIKGS